jgi:hypothetical protein
MASVMWHILFLFTAALLLFYPVSTQAVDKPIVDLPPHWEGMCVIITLDMVAFMRTKGFPPPTEHVCDITLNDRLYIVMKVSAIDPHRIPSVNLKGFFAHAYAPIILRFNDGTTYELPPEPYDPGNIPQVSAGWSGRTAQNIIAHMQKASTVSLRYTASPSAVTTQLLPAGIIEDTLSLKTFRQAWKALNAAMQDLPPLR